MRVKHYVSNELNQHHDVYCHSAKISIKTKGGLIHKKIVTKAKGTPGNPLSFNDIKNKFRSCVKGLIDNETIENIVLLINELQDLSSIDDLCKILILEKTKHGQ